jgi:translation initiation factor 5A
MEDEHIETTDAGASLTYPMQVGSVRKGGFVLLKGFPCKVMDIATAKTGKHGSAKAKMTGIDIFTGKKYEEIHPTSHNIDVPNISRLEYTLVDISADGFLSLMDEDGSTKEDVRLPESDEVLTRQIREGFENGANLVLCVLKAMGNEAVVSAKEV